MSELMKRATPGLALAGAALASVWMFDPALHPTATSTVAAGVVQGGAADGPGQLDSGTSTDPGASTDSGTSTDPGPSADPGASTDSGTSSTADCSTTAPATGDAAMTPWGPVQVRMEFASDGAVCSVQALVYPNGDHRSQMINSMAIPTLNAQATEQGVEFDGVSGATYTTEAYRASMQSILDQR
jgi:uncharacterized protein with FMN-binding domain